MSRRVNLSQAAVVPWRVPDIHAPIQVLEAPDFREVDLQAENRARAQNLAAAPAAPLDPGIFPGMSQEVDAGDAGALAAEIDRRLVEGREQGYAEGFIVGQRAAEQRFADQLRRFEDIVQRLGEPIRALERPVEEAVIALALEVARWVIGNEITMSRDHLVRLVRDAVGRVPIDVGPPTIMVHPADAELIRALAPDLEAKGLPLVVDETIEPGGCLIVADGADGIAVKDRRWHPRAGHGICEVDLTLASRWRDAMLAMFEGEDA